MYVVFVYHSILFFIILPSLHFYATKDSINFFEFQIIDEQPSLDCIGLSAIL